MHLTKINYTCLLLHSSGGIGDISTTIITTMIMDGIL
jgi:hypothetical protein